MRRVENLTPQYGLLVLLLPHANEVVGVVVGVKKKKTRHRSIWPLIKNPVGSSL